MLTAIRRVADADGRRRAFLGVDFDMRVLLTRELYNQPEHWLQL